MSPKPPVCANGVHSEVMKRTRLREDAGTVSIGPGAFGLVAGGVSMDFPAFAADWEASAMRTRALGETDFASTVFFLAAGLATEDLRDVAEDASALLAAGVTIEVEILFCDLLLPDGDLAMGNHNRFAGTGKARALTHGWRCGGYPCAVSQ